MPLAVLRRLRLVLGLIQLRQVPFKGAEAAYNRGVKLAVYLWDIRHGLAEDFRSVMDVMERTHPSDFNRQVIRGCGAWGWFLVRLISKKCRLEAVHLVSVVTVNLFYFLRGVSRTPRGARFADPARDPD